VTAKDSNDADDPAAPEKDDWRPAPNGEEQIDDEEDAAAAMVEAPISTAQRMAEAVELEEQNKENMRRGQVAGPGVKSRAFIDAQQDAERVRWEDSQAPRVTTQEAEASTNLRKRPIPVEHEDDAEEDDDDVSEDEGFQQDTRKVDVAQRRRQAPTTQRRTAEAGTPEPQRRHAEPGSSAKRQRQESDRTEEADDDEEEETPPVSRFKRSQALAKAANVTRHASGGNGRKPREAWSEEATNALIEYIEEYGCVWAKIKEMDKASDNLFEERDQVALKDRARNMKFTFMQ